MIPFLLSYKQNILYNVWKSILTLRDAITITRTNVRHLQQEVKLYDILTEQVHIHKPVILFLYLYLFRIEGPIGILNSHIK